MASKNIRKRGRVDRIAKKTWRTLLILCLALTLLASPIILAQQEKMKPASKSTGNLSPQETISPASLTPNRPSKEYIYLGGKLVATEEPAP